MNYILASRSPRRRELLRAAGISFEVDSARAAEVPWDGIESPEVLTRRLASAKAREVSLRHPGKVTIGADTVVALDGVIFGKPRDPDEAFQTLERLSGKTHSVVTGVALAVDGELLRQWECTTRVRFRDLSGEEIREYLRLVPVLDKAGSYAIQEHGELLVESIDGLRSNVIGVPVEELLTELQRLPA